MAAEVLLWLLVWQRDRSLAVWSRRTYYGGYYPAGYVGPIGYGAPGWEAIACRAIARSIRSAAPIGVAMADGTIAGSPPLLSWRVPAEMKRGSHRYGILGVERRSPR